MSGSARHRRGARRPEHRCCRWRAQPAQPHAQPNTSSPPAHLIWGSDGYFDAPQGIGAGDGVAYVADQNNCRVQVGLAAPISQFINQSTLEVDRDAAGAP